LHPRLEFALCFGGNGINCSVHAAEMIRARIDSQPHALDTLFGFARQDGERIRAGAVPRFRSRWTSNPGEPRPADWTRSSRRAIAWLSPCLIRGNNFRIAEIFSHGQGLKPHVCQ
jgi:hypothetical protein